MKKNYIGISSSLDILILPVKFRHIVIVYINLFFDIGFCRIEAIDPFSKMNGI